MRVLHASIDSGALRGRGSPGATGSRTRLLAHAPDDVVALFVGMNYRLKGLAPLLRSLADVPNQHTFQASRGRQREVWSLRSAREVSRRTRAVKFLGFRADPRDAYFGADFLVHPTFYDPCSLVALEALACGLPVLTTRYNGASELLPRSDHYSRSARCPRSRGRRSRRCAIPPSCPHGDWPRPRPEDAGPLKHTTLDCSRCLKKWLPANAQLPLPPEAHDPCLASSARCLPDRGHLLSAG